MLTPNLRRGAKQWRSSSHSGPNGACVEVASLTDAPARSTAAWRTSRYSDRDGECVEVADLPTPVAMRDSTYPAHSHLDFPRNEWAALIAGIRGGEL